MLRDNPFFHKWLCGNRRLSATPGRHIPGKAISLYYLKTYLLWDAGYAQRRLTAATRTPYFQGFLVKEKGKALGRPMKDIDHRELTRLRENGISVGKIASSLGVSRATIYNHNGV